jgi:hypothetical protein
MPWPTTGIRHTYPTLTTASAPDATPGEFKRVQQALQFFIGKPGGFPGHITDRPALFIGPPSADHCTHPSEPLLCGYPRSRGGVVSCFRTVRDRSRARIPMDGLMMCPEVRHYTTLAPTLIARQFPKVSANQKSIYCWSFTQASVVSLSGLKTS